jgi:signal peptidase I
MNAQNYHYADRKFSVGDIYETVVGSREVVAIWIDRKYGDVIRTKEGGDYVPGDFYRAVIRKVR